MLDSVFVDSYLYTVNIKNSVMNHIFTDTYIANFILKFCYSLLD